MSTLEVATKDSMSRINNSMHILLLLFFVNLLNYFDRTIPAVVFEPMRHEFGLSDLELGILGGAFTIVYAIAGIPLGRLADTGSRKKLLSVGITVWSLFGAATGYAWNFITLLLTRFGVGIGEASCAPTSTSIIGDLFPPEKRARAMGIFMLGLPLGLLLAFFTVGAMVEAFDSWRAPFFIAAVPGIIIAVILLFIREPKRGESENLDLDGTKVERPIRKILSIQTIWWVILSGVTVNFALYAGNGFMVALLQRYYELSLSHAAIVTGLIVGLTGLIGLTFGGILSDKVSQRNKLSRLHLGTFGMLAAALCTYLALTQDAESLVAFSVLFGTGWLCYYSYYTTVYPALQDVVEPRLRATAMALYFAGMYLLGGASGMVVVGGLSDYLANEAMIAAGASEMTEYFKAIGMHDAMYLIPLTFLMTAVFIHLSTRSFMKDHDKMLEEALGPQNKQ